MVSSTVVVYSTTCEWMFIHGGYKNLTQLFVIDPKTSKVILKQLHITLV